MAKLSFNPSVILNNLKLPIESKSITDIETSKPRNIVKKPKYILEYFLVVIEYVITIINNKTTKPVLLPANNAVTKAIKKNGINDTNLLLLIFSITKIETIKLTYLIHWLAFLKMPPFLKVEN